jgi:3-methyladenine DNA glycosylase AlkD
VVGFAQALRGAFALMACLALREKAAPDKSFLALLPLIEKGVRDERNFVKKGVNWALRAIGRRGAALHFASVTVARRLADSPQAAARWVGKDALRELTSPAVMRRLAVKRSKEKI